MRESLTYSFVGFVSRLCIDSTVAQTNSYFSVNRIKLLKIAYKELS